MIKLAFQLNKAGKICKANKLPKMEISVRLGDKKITVPLNQVKLDFGALEDEVYLYYDDKEEIVGERDLVLKCLNKARKMYGQQH